MKCPQCGNELMETVRQQVLVDQCTVCGGIWLGRDRIAELLKTQAAHLFERQRQVYGDDQDTHEKTGSRLSRGLLDLLSP